MPLSVAAYQTDEGLVESSATQLTGTPGSTLPLNPDSFTHEAPPFVVRMTRAADVPYTSNEASAQFGSVGLQTIERTFPDGNG